MTPSKKKKENEEPKFENNLDHMDPIYINDDHVKKVPLKDRIIIYSEEEMEAEKQRLRDELDFEWDDFPQERLEKGLPIE